jgi:hypothetical protein
MSLQDALMFWVIVVVVGVFLLAALVEVYLQLAEAMRGAAGRRRARRRRVPSVMDSIGEDLSRLDRLDGLGREVR